MTPDSAARAHTCVRETDCHGRDHRPPDASRRGAQPRGCALRPAARLPSVRGRGRAMARMVAMHLSGRAYDGAWLSELGHDDEAADSLAHGAGLELPVGPRRDVVAVIASPLERAQETAAPIAAAFGVPVGTDPRLIEAENHFQGMTFGVGDGSLRNPGGTGPTCATRCGRPGASRTASRSTACSPPSRTRALPPAATRSCWSPTSCRWAGHPPRAGEPPAVARPAQAPVLARVPDEPAVRGRRARLDHLHRARRGVAAWCRDRGRGVT